MTTPRLCVCIKNSEYEASLELRKIYEVVDDEEARVLRQIRVIDESGEDYLYPEDFFVRVDLPQSLEKQLLESA
ncbi:MAG: hypothetical protein GXP28_11310 [Planctomycetes bacterium]|nr:hypothetical protein [Planctomycetota bacterium]